MDLRIAVIGAGYMGSQHARVISASPQVELEVIIDVDRERAHATAELYGARSSTNVNAAKDCDAVIVASNTECHVDIARSLIQAGMPVLVEKPVATDLEDVELLVKAAGDANVALSCGFVERFNPVVMTALDILEEPPTHMVAVRHSPTAPRIMNSVIHDLLIHDVDLALRFMGHEPVTRVTGASWAPPGFQFAEIADCTMQFAHGPIASMSASRAGQRKLRSVQLGSSSILLDLDLLRLDITVYRHVRHQQVPSTPGYTYRAESIIDIPFVRHAGEPLSMQFDHFLGLIEGAFDLAQERTSILAAHRAVSEIERSCLPPDGSDPPHRRR